MYGYENYYDEQMYEPTPLDELFVEYREKCKTILLSSVQNEINAIRNENSMLKVKNEEYKKRENEISRKEIDLKYKEDNLKREVEHEFYQTNIENLLTQYIEESEVWFAVKTGFPKEKCPLCNAERKLIAEFPNGEMTIKDCECSKNDYKYIPEMATLNMITFTRKNSRYQSDRKYYLSRTYSPNNRNDYDDYEYREFGIQYVVKEFNEDTINLRSGLNYGKKIGFTSKEQCQLYCDWINSEEKIRTNESCEIPKEKVELHKEKYKKSK